MLEEQLLDSSGRYPAAETHLAKIRDLLKLSISDVSLEDVSNFHHEICVAINCLEEAEPTITLLEYEPRLKHTDRSIDLRVNMDSRTVWVDVKTIRPELIDRWRQLIETRDQEKIPESVTVSLNEKCGGGGDLALDVCEQSQNALVNL